MSSHHYGSIAFSENFSIQERSVKERALQQLQDYFSGIPSFAAHVREAVNEFIEEADGVSGYSTEEILRAELPQAQVADLERFGFKFYPVTAI